MTALIHKGITTVVDLTQALSVGQCLVMILEPFVRCFQQSTLHAQNMPVFGLDSFKACFYSCPLDIGKLGSIFQWPVDVSISHSRPAGRLYWDNLESLSIQSHINPLTLLYVIEGQIISDVIQPVTFTMRVNIQIYKDTVLGSLIH